MEILSNENRIKRLESIRKIMQTNSIDAIIIPRFDAHMGEYIAKSDERLHWATGFSGSAGACIITQNQAIMYVDGRYTVQVQNECPNEIFDYKHLHNEFMDQWLQNEFSGEILGLDPMYFSITWFEKFQEALNSSDKFIKQISFDIVDELWVDRPAEASSLARNFPTQIAGKSSKDKILDISQIIKTNGADYLVETQQDNIAWLLNIRGDDVDFNPFINSFLTLNISGGVNWYVNAKQLPEDLSLPSAVSVKTKSQFLSDISTNASAKKIAMLDQKFSPAAAKIATGKYHLFSANPITLYKSRKNKTELNGFRDCHVKDGLAWFRFGNWLFEHQTNKAGENRSLTELQAQEKILSFRQQQQGFIYDSFNPISAAGPNGAMCHYKASGASNFNLLDYETYLLDSGGQYGNGTTDATRSYVLGKASSEYKNAYTSVLIGFIELARLRFPIGTKGHQIDAFARARLWQDGLDYDHGTGHGVGHCLSVHEFPQRIGKDVNDVNLMPGMILSIEPGFYKANEFGIRIENLFEIVDLGNGFLGFDNLSIMPIYKQAINVATLNEIQLKWLNDFHKMVQRTLMPLVDEAEMPLLLDQTQPL